MVDSNLSQISDSSSDMALLPVNLFLILSELITLKNGRSLRTKSDLPEWEGPQRTIISFFLSINPTSTMDTSQGGFCAASGISAGVPYRRAPRNSPIDIYATCPLPISGGGTRCSCVSCATPHFLGAIETNCLVFWLSFYPELPTTPQADKTRGWVVIFWCGNDFPTSAIRTFYWYSASSGPCTDFLICIDDFVHSEHLQLKMMRGEPSDFSSQLEAADVGEARNQNE